MFYNTETKKGKECKRNEEGDRKRKKMRARER